MEGFGVGVGAVNFQSLLDHLTFKPSMEGQRCLLLFCTLGLAFGEMRNENNIDFVGFLRRFHPGLLVRDEPFLMHEDSEIDSRKALGPPEFISVSEQAKDITARRDTKTALGPLVLTKDGKIKGITVDKAHVFYGIPYADPPIGAYRWKPPRPVTPWAGVYDASFPRAACMQACSGPIAAECPRTVRPLFISSSSLHACTFFSCSM